MCLVDSEETGIDFLFAFDASCCGARLADEVYIFGSTSLRQKVTVLVVVA